MSLFSAKATSLFCRLDTHWLYRSCPRWRPGAIRIFCRCCWCTSVPCPLTSVKPGKVESDIYLNLRNRRHSSQYLSWLELCLIRQIRHVINVRDCRFNSHQGHWIPNPCIGCRFSSCVGYFFVPGYCSLFCHLFGNSPFTCTFKSSKLLSCRCQISQPCGTLNWFETNWQPSFSALLGLMII